MKRTLCGLLVGLMLLGVQTKSVHALAWTELRKAVLLLKNTLKHLATAEQKRRIELYKKFHAAKGVPVCLKAHKGQYVSAGNLSTNLYANRAKCSIWEKFKIVNGKKALYSGDRVKILTYQYRYWSAQRVGSLFCSRVVAKAWEYFTLKKVGGGGKINSGDKVMFLSHHKKFVSAEHGGGSFLVANRSHANAWEQFQVVLLKP